MSDFLAELRRLEWEFDEGLWAPAIVNHTDTRTDFAGANYAPFDEVINNYTFQVSGLATRVDLLGSNNNIIDFLIPTGVSVVPSNSAGLQVVAVGSGVTEQDKTDIVNGVFSRAVEAGYTFEEMFRMIAADAGGSVEQQPDGSYVIKGIDESTDRIEGALATNNGRTISGRDGS